MRNEPTILPFAEEIHCKKATRSEKNYGTNDRDVILYKYIFIRKKMLSVKPDALKAEGRLFNS